MVNCVQLISLVHDRRPLWDVTSDNYHNREMARKLWQEIAVEMGLDEASQTVKGKWQNLRDTFRKEHKKFDGVTQKSTWKFYNQLLFLGNGFYKKDPACGTDTGESTCRKRKHVKPDVKPDVNALNRLLSLDKTHTSEPEKVDSRINSVKNIEKDEDYYFLMSLLPHLRDIPKRKKLATRIRLQQVLLEEEIQEMQSPNSSESSFGYSSNDVSPPLSNAMQVSKKDTQHSLILFCQSEPNES